MGKGEGFWKHLGELENHTCVLDPVEALWRTLHRSQDIHKHSQNLAITLVAFKNTWQSLKHSLSFHIKIKILSFWTDKSIIIRQKMILQLEGQCRFGSKDWMTKIVKYYIGNNFKKSKIAVYGTLYFLFIPRPPECTAKLQKPPTLKRVHPAFQNNINFVLIFFCRSFTKWLSNLNTLHA